MMTFATAVTNATQKDQLKYHVESNHDETRYNCNQCDYSATQKDQLKHHVEVTHEKLFYNCEQINKEHLKEHIKLVHKSINEPTIIDFIKRGRLRQGKEASKETMEKYTGAGAR